MHDIVQFPKKARVKKTMSIEEYVDALEAVELLVEETRPHCLDAARRVITEIKFCAAFNPGFREETRNVLHEIIDELYAEAQEL